ncbi:hypothetical protein NHX12_024394 [Muraenolepis orangiensis]|uniref:Uncharacterized protein n=1 Tax=Muraenolepis orangiensis TaxID=630683 RepID=A0A9Q0EJB4_9TELE|nr:hypothetical protein NHX12_024394 [Muraenolepis orangiensis]
MYRGLEPEIQKLISKHKQELKRLRAAHEAELQGSDQRAAQRYVLQCQELREQLGREKDAAKQRYEKQLQEEEMSLQQQRRRLYTEVSDEKERLTQLAARQRAELEDLRRRLEDNSSLAGHALPEELDRTPVSDTGEQYELELRELEHSERASVEKQQQLRKLQTETEGELIRGGPGPPASEGAGDGGRRSAVSPSDQSRDKMAEERHSLAQVIRQEFAERLVETEEENRRMRAEVSEARARLRLEVERVTGEKEAELAEVHQRSPTGPNRSPTGAQQEPNRSPTGPNRSPTGAQQEPHGAQQEPIRSPTGAQQEPNRAHQEPNRSPTGAQQEPNRSPTGAQQEPNRSPIGPIRSPTGAQQEPNRSPTGAQQEPNRSPTGAQQEPNRSPTGAQQEPNRSPTGRTRGYALVPKCVFVCWSMY